MRIPPNPPGQSLKAPRRHRSVLMMLGIYNVAIHRAVAQYAAEHDWHLNADMAAVPVVPKGWTGDGVLAGLGDWNAPVHFVKAIRARGVPVVDIYNAAAHEVSLPRVLGDHRAAGCLAAEHFLERGWRHFAWFSRGRHVVPSLRLQGYGDTLAKHGHGVIKLGGNLQGDFQRNRWQKINTELARELVAAPKPLAVFAQNDLGAVAVMEACDTAGLRTPEDVAILGVDDNELIVNSVRVPLSSVQDDLHRLGYEGAALLDRLMDGEAPPPDPLLIQPRGISVRASTDTFAVNHPALRAALHFIDKNLRRSFGVDAIVAESGLSRRALEQLFQKELRQTIHERVMQLRLGRARRLLGNSNLSIEDVASEAGFSHAPHLHRLFQREFGMTPRAYRLRQKSVKPGGASASVGS